VAPAAVDALPLAAALLFGPVLLFGAACFDLLPFSLAASLLEPWAPLDGWEASLPCAFVHRLLGCLLFELPVAVMGGGGT